METANIVRADIYKDKPIVVNEDTYALILTFDKLIKALNKLAENK